MLNNTTHHVPKQVFRLLKEGTGGLVYFHHASSATMPTDPKDPTFIPRVGVHGITTGLGVYLALSERCCFAAHISAHVRNRKSSTVRHTISNLEGLDLKAQISERLHATLSSMGHNVHNPGVTKPYTKRSLMMVCPGMYREDGMEQVGVYVARAIWEYLGLERERYPVDIGSSGFVLDHLKRPVLFASASAQSGVLGGLRNMEMFIPREEVGEHVREFEFEVEAKGE